MAVSGSVSGELQTGWEVGALKGKAGKMVLKKGNVLG